MSALKKMVLLLTAVAVSVPLWAKVELEYFYADDGTLTGRAVNGVRQNFVYDKRGQLLAVKDARGNDIERYVYDPAGNILSKTIGGVTTKYTYDKANQLLTSTRNGKVTKYEYDAAGRLIREGDKVYFYGYKDKILTVTVNGKKKLTFDYHMDGQLASASGNGKSEEFLWDGLALIKRGNTRYVNEPYVTGGNPVIAGNDVMFNDMLGSTVSINDKAVGMTSFGETANSKAMYTGKPYVDGLGYAFLFRNYRTDLGKWQTTDPLGYPDGWNQLAYVSNETLGAVDFGGGLKIQCLDYNNKRNPVTEASQLVVGSLAFGAAFSITTRGITVTFDTVTKEVTIGIPIAIMIPLGTKKECDIAVGTILTYKPHGNSQNDCDSENAFYEIVLAHERGHATSFFQTQLPLIRQRLLGINIDGKDYSTESGREEVRQTVIDIVVTTAQQTLGDSNSKANSFTYNAISSSWKPLPDLDGVKRWIKE